MRALSITYLILVCLAVRGISSSAAAEPDPPATKAPDITQLNLKEIGLKLIEPKRNKKTGFVVGGKNPTRLIGRLTEINGRSIAKLESRLRPGKFSSAGFLGKDESLLEVLVRVRLLRGAGYALPSRTREVAEGLRFSDCVEAAENKIAP